MVSSRLSLSSSLSFTRTSSLSILERRKRLRRILLESLENRMLMAFDPMELAGDAAWVDSRQEGLPGYRVDLDAVLKGQDLPPVETVAYLERVFGSVSGTSVDQPWFPTIQRAYDHWSQEQGLAFSYSTLTGEGELLGEGEAGGPRLLSVAPNSGDIFSFNTLNTLPESPTELVFRFDGSDGIRTSSIANGIRVTRSGRDGVFGNGNDQVIVPGFLGLGDNDRIVVMRFASTLPDDTYRVEVMGEDVPAQGLNAIQNLAGRKLTARSGDRDIVNFKLELGAQVVAVVPQPVDRSATNTISMTGNAATLSLTARQGGLASAAVGTNVNFRINQTAAATTVASYAPATNTLTVDVGVNGTLNDVATAINNGLVGDFSAAVVTNGGYVIAAADAGSRVVSLGSTVLDPKLNQIRVYFNNDDLFATRVTTNPLGGNPSVVDPASYQLILTNDTVQPNDDRAFLPSSVTYDPATDVATLTFASSIEQLAGTGTYRLRVGTKDAVETSLNLPAVSVRAPADPQGFVSGAQGLGTNPADAAGVVTGSLSVLVNQSIITTSTNVLPIDYPGSNFEPGHRDIQDETHQNGTEDGDPQISTLFYNFALDRSYGNNALGQPVFTSITPEQMQRVREIFEFYSEQAGIDVVESVGSGFTIVVGDLFPNGAISGPSGTLGVANSQTGLAIIDGADVWNNAFGGSFMRTTMHEIGHLLGLGHATDLPSGTFMQGFADPNPPADGPFPGDFDVNHLQFLHRPDNRDVDLYRFEIPVGTNGQVRIETVAERLASSSNLDSHLTLFRQLPDGKLEVVSANDDYFSEDSFLHATVTAGVYFIGVTSTGNQDYNPLTGNTGSGGTSQGTYQLRFDFVPTLNTSITDTSGTVLDGDGDGQAGGNFDFWFRAAAPVGTATPEVPKTIYVDKGYSGAQNGSAAQPYSSIPAAVAAAVPGDVIRVVGSIGADNSIATTGDNPAYEIGRGGVGNVVLSDGVTLEVPNGVTLMLEAGAIFKIGGSRIVAGSRDAGIDNRFSSLQVLGVPGNPVLFTSYNDQSLGIDTNPLATTPTAGDWGGLEIHNDVDRAEGRGDYERKGIFLNYIANADIRYGGGQITVSTPSPTISPIYLAEARPTLLNNRITFSTGSAITADPNSFEETRFTEPRYQMSGPYRPDYDRVGPEIRGNTLLNNSINGLFVRIPTLSGNQLQTLEVQSRFDDKDIVHVLGENLIIAGAVGGSFRESIAPNVSLVQTIKTSAAVPGDNIRYKVTQVDRYGGESIPSAATTTLVVGRRAVTPNVASLNFAFNAHGFVNGDSVVVSSTGALPAGIPANTRFFVVNATANDFQLARTVGGAPINFTSVGSGTISVSQTVQINNLPLANNDFVGRRLWRSVNGGAFVLVAELDADTPTYLDVGLQQSINLVNPNATSLQRARPDSRLNIDPGIIVKSLNSRIEVGIGAELLAEGTPEAKVIFTSRFDDRFGAGGTFDTNSDGASSGAAGNWGGIISRHMGTLSIDSALITFAGGTTSVPGGFGGFNAIELHQSTGRIANSVLENNGSGLGGNIADRDARGVHDASVIFVRNGQPILVDNIIRNNTVAQTAAVSIDANSMKAIPVQDSGRMTGENDQKPGSLGNLGPLVKGNRLLANGLSGMRVRGAILTTETVWDDTDIVHVLENEIIVPNFHTYGGMRLQSRVDESLVVKLGPGAGLTATGTLLDITDRIGGSIQVIGAPGFPVVMTSIKDDSVGAGFDPVGRPLLDTGNDGNTPVTAADAWRSILLNQNSNDRNVDTAIELEADQIQDIGTNDTPFAAQFLGGLARTLSGGDENLRLGFTVSGAVASPSDLDVFSFTAVAGTPVWFDIDRTDAALDSVIELIDSNGRILGQSNNSLTESVANAVGFIDASLIAPDRVQPMDQDPFAPKNSFLGTAVDFQSVNPGDAGLRVVLPGNGGAQNTYYVRVRSSNVAPGQASSRLQDAALVRSGLTTGAYRMQVRLQQKDEIAGSTVRYADIRNAQIGVDAIGLPAHSPLLGSSSEQSPIAQVTDPSTALNLGNLATSDRGVFSLAGNLATNNNFDFYQFSISRNLTQSGGAHISTTFDVDYASDYGGPNTTLWVYRVTGTNMQLVLTGTDSNIADDRSRFGKGSDVESLSRGSFGAQDAFIGTQELPDGNYIVAVSNNSQMASQLRQFQQAAPPDALVRLEPIDSVQRIVTDRFEAPRSDNVETAAGPRQVAFSSGTAALTTNNAVPWTLADVTTFVVRNNGTSSQLQFVNALTGALEADGGTLAGNSQVLDVAMSPDGRLVAYVIDPTQAPQTDANNGQFILIDPSANGAITPLGNSGIQTFNTEQTAAGPPPTFTIQQRTKNGAQVGDGIQFHALAFYNNGGTGGQVAAGDVRLFGVGRRSPGNENFFRPSAFDANGNITAIVLVDTEPTNIVYRLDPATGAPINPAGVPDRAGNNRANGAGTNRVEFGTFVTANRATRVTGLADIGTTLVAVSNAGELFQVNVGNGTNAFGAVNSTITLLDGGVPIAFEGLTAGPANLENGRFANILFGTTNDGTIYAFDAAGQFQNVFPGGNFKMKSNTNATGVGVRGLDFSPLDVNLWHMTDTRGADLGHGREQTFDNSRPTRQNGTNSLYFGFEKSNNDVATRQIGDWDPVHSVFDNGYNLPGGAHGAIESVPVDLRDFSADDLPTLYFTYYLDTENANSDLSDAARMRDAFRVYISGDNGRWIEVVTNNSVQNGAFNNGLDEFDTNISNYADPYGRPLMVQEAYDVGDNGAPDNWRQARINLAQFAGQKNVTIRFEFSTGASFRTNDPMRGGVELRAVEGALINDGNTFTVATVDQTPAVNQTFEFDLGLTLNLPSGPSIPNGAQLNVNGNIFTFSQTSNVGNNIQYSLTDTSGQIAAAVGAKLAALFPVFFNSVRPNTLSIPSAPVGGTYSVTGLSASTIVSLPGVTGTNVRVPVHQGMTAAQVRDAVRTALAATFNIATQATNLDVWPVYGNTIKMYKYQVTNAGPLSVATRSGDQFGVQPSGGGLADMDERAQNNAGNVGVFIDDIIIGLAERGETVIGALPTPVTATSFVPNLQYEQNGFLVGTSQINEIEFGRYQLEIRTSAEYAIQSGQNLALGNPLPPSRSFDSNDRLTPSIGLSVNLASNFIDGEILTLSDGVNQLNFEFDVTNGPGDIAAGTAAGNIPIVLNANDRVDQIAVKIRNAINSAAAQASLSISASILGQGNTDTAASNSEVVVLHGPAAITRTGSLTSSAINVVTWGDESGFGEDEGDANRLRDQGMVVISSTSFTNNQNVGVRIDAAARGPSGPSFPGAPINFPTNNADRLAPGVVVMNNIFAGNLNGGIIISGDAANPQNGNDVTVPSTVARVLNNTIFGTRNGDTGILVDQGATPVILNNIIANTATGINVATAGPKRVIGANLYQNNAANTNPVNAAQSFEVIVTASPFVNAGSGFFYPAPGSPAIDSSLEALDEVDTLNQIKTALKLPASPALAPDRDITGQRRVDDPSVNAPAGLGQNVFKDRGAVERADVARPSAVILRPQDNDSANTDIDRNVSYIRLQSGLLDAFSILLTDGEGVGPNPSTVTADSIVLTQNGRRLLPGVDYVFGYNANSRTVRLTPLAGIWRNDSVYEITLNNQDGFRLTLLDGTSMTNGGRVTIQLASGGTRVFELNTTNPGGTNVWVPYTVSQSAYQIAAQLVTAINRQGNGLVAYLQGDGNLMIHGATSVTRTGFTNAAAVTIQSIGAIRDLAGNAIQANRANSLTQFTIVMPGVSLDYGDAIANPTVQTSNGPRHAILPVDAPLLVLGAIADGDSDGQPSNSNLADDNDSLVTLGSMPLVVATTGPVVLNVPAFTAALEGQQIRVTDSTVPDPLPNDVVFEFTTDATLTNASALPVTISNSATATQVASALGTAMRNAVLQGLLRRINPVVSGASVFIGGDTLYSVDLSLAANVQRVLSGDIRLTVPASGLADGQTLSITDGNGRTLTFELNDTGAANQAVAGTNVRVDVTLATDTPDTIAQKLATAINGQVQARNLVLAPVTVSGSTIAILADDEDGVTFGGIFSPRANPVPVTVTSTGPGMLDAWFDWNGDGDFGDAGEQVIVSQPVQAGANVFTITTPNIASLFIGNINSRFRLSALGNLLTDGVGIGGEVEDHLVEVLGGTPPVAVANTYTVDEDVVLNVSAALGVLANDTDAENDPITVFDHGPTTAGIQTFVTTSNGVLVINADGSFTYTPNQDFFGTDTFVYFAADRRYTSNTPATVTITVNPINDRPTANADTITILEDAVTRLPGSTFWSNDVRGPANESGQTLRIVDAVIVGPTGIGGTVSVANDELVYNPPADYNNRINGPVLVRLTIRDGGVAGGDANPLEDSNTLTINLTQVNDAPIFTLPTSTSTIEDSGDVTVAGFVTGILPGNVTSTDEVTVDNQVVSFRVRAFNPTLFATQPAITNNGDGTATLTYRLAQDVNNNNRPITGADFRIEVIAVDNGRTLTGAYGTHAAPNDDESDPKIFTISVDARNDAPEFTLPDLRPSVIEDAGPRSVPNFATGIRAGTVRTDDEAATQTVSFTLTPVDPAAFKTLPAISPTGTLTYELAPEVNSAFKDLTVSVYLEDTGLNGGGNVNRSATQTFSIVAAQINDAPIFTLPTSTATFEDSGAITVPNFVTGILPGPALATDEVTVDNQVVTFRVRALDPSLFAVQPAITNNGNGTANLTYTLAPHVNDFNRPVTGANLRIEVVALDNGRTLTQYGAHNPPNDDESDPQTFAVSVEPRNDAPEFTLPNLTPTVDEDAGLRAVPGFATGVRPGPVAANDEVPQTVTFTLTARDPSAFKTLPAMTSTGLLTYELAADVNSRIKDLTVEVYLQDDGLNGGGHVNRSATQTFSIVAASINDAPIFTIPTTTSTFEDSGDLSVASFATGILPGPATATDEVTIDNQVVTFRVRALDPSLFAVQPTLTNNNNGTATLTYKLAPDVNNNNRPITGADLRVEVIAVDNGRTLAVYGTHAAPNDDESDPKTFTIDVSARNDAPEFTIPNTLPTVDEDAGPVTMSNFITNIRPGTVNSNDEAGQTLVFLVTAVDPTAFSTQPAITPAGVLTYQLATDVNSRFKNLTVQVALQDNGPNGSVAQGGAHVNTSATQSFSIVARHINDIPDFAIPEPSKTVLEDNEAETGVAITSFPGFAANIVRGPATALDEPGNQNVQFNVISVSNPALFETQPAISPTGTMTFKTKKDQNGSAVVVVQLQDSEIAAPTDSRVSVLRTFTINITPVNDAPEFTIPTTLSATEDQGLVLLNSFATDLRPGTTTSTDENTQTFTVAVAALDPSKFSVQPSLAADGTLQFRTAVDVNGPLPVTVVLTDDGPTATPTVPNVNRSIVKTFTINVAAVNDSPLFTIPNRQLTVDEDREATLGIPVSTFPAFATNILMGPSTAVDEQVPSQLPTFLVSTNAPELFEQAPSIDANGALIFKTAANKNGRATVTVRLQDSGPSSPAPNSNISAEQTITITINPINDAPQFVIPSTLAVEEDQGVVSITGFASNVLRGPLSATDESTQEVTFFATARNPAAFEIQPSILPDGTLSFKTAKDVNRNTRTSGNATIDLGVLVYLVDNGTGSPLPHSNQSPTQTFTLDVAPVNDPPIPDAFNVPGIEDGSILISASDVLVGDTPGPADEASQTLVLTQVERTSDRGGVIVPVFNGTEIVAFRYTPAVNVANADFFRYVVSDNGSPSRSATGTVTINVAGANDPPQFTPGVPQVFTFEDSGLVSIPWATNILAGPPAAFDEISGPNAQTVSFEVLPNRPELFAQGPAVSSTGVLTFTPALNANGLAVVLVTAVDSGSNVAPSNNRSATATLTISISSVNDAPVFTPGPNISIAEDSGIQTIAWATGIAPAAGLLTTPPTAGDESGQVVDFIVTPSVPSLFAGAPTISATGQLQFTPASNAFGSTAVVVTARDSGAGDGLNQNLSVPRTFTITINPSNDAPQGNTDNYVIGEDQLLSVPARGLLENDTDIDLPADSITAVQVTSTSVLGATVSISPDGSFTYDPRSVRAIQQLVDNQSISDSFTYRVRDASGTESNLVTVGITVNGSNDAPIAVNDRFPISAGQTVLLAVLANDTDVDSPIDERTIEIGTLPINGTARVLQTGRIEYIPRSGFRGTDTLSYRVRDSFGLLSNEAVVTINTNNPPVAVNDSSNTGVNRSVSINVLRNDFDTDGTLNPSSVEIVVAPSAGTATVGVDGTINYIPPTNFTGTATLSYVVADQEGASSNVATVSIRVSDAIYQNTRDRYDVNADGFVSPIDILLVLNDLNLNRPRRLDPTEFTPPPFIDVNGDGNVGPIDALEVINFLNLRGNGGGEGEVSADAFVPQFVNMVTPEQMIATVGPMVVRELQATLTDSILRAQQDRTTTVPAVASYVDGRLDSVDLAQESLENVLASLSWDRDRENDSELEDEVFGSLIDDLLT